MLQQGTPQELFEKPTHRFVGYFIGSPGMNFFPCRLTSDGAEVAGQHIPLPVDLLLRAPKAEVLEIGIRPEAIAISDGNSAGLAVQICDVEDLGLRKIATCLLGEHELKVVVPSERPVPLDRGSLILNPAMTRLYADGHLVR